MEKDLTIIYFLKKNLVTLIIWGLFLTYRLYIRIFQIEYTFVCETWQTGCRPDCFFQIINSYTFYSIKPLKYDIDTSVCE